MSKTAREYVDHYFDGGPYDGELFLADLKAAGFVIVPKEPTQEMISLALKKVDEPSYDVTKGYISADDLVTSYRAMIAAASQEPKP